MSAKKMKSVGKKDRAMESDQVVDETGTQAQDEVSQVNGASESETKSASSAMTQREGVFTAIQKIMSEDQIPYDPAIAVKPLLSDAQLKRAYEDLAAGFIAGAIALKDNESNRQKLADPKLLELYIVGLVNNWLRRDPRLNGKPKVEKKSATEAQAQGNE